MIVYVDIEHTRVREQNPDKWQQRLSLTLGTKYMLEELSGDPCLIVHYEKLTPGLLRNVRARAVLVSGNRTEFPHYQKEKLAGLWEVYKEASQPILGICGGAQMMAEAYGARMAPIDPEGSGTMDEDTWTQRVSESGFTSLRKTAEHPLLAGLGPELNMMEKHYWEIKSLPDGFRNIAETDITPLQFIVHESLPLFGTQFHPEEWDNSNPDGRKLLENFFGLAG